ncbi:MAG: ParB N-terminal domain-containing protein [Proteobacteria bacterium]|nr:ParB N-terminal domain-containing protein [Pseudomonadota bacterium]
MNWSNKVKKARDDIMQIAGEKIPVKIVELDPLDLKYWANNPRIYSIVHGSEEPLSQDEIEEQLLERPHVRELIKDIAFHGALLNNIILLDEKFEVIEGNSRLAAYKFLKKSKPIEYPKIKCTVLPGDTSDILIYAYLNQEHIKGKTAWIPYEQAGIFYRLWKEGKEVEEIRKNLNIGPQIAKRFINTYKFMVENGEDKPNRWSYYDEYLKNRLIAKKRKSDNRFDEVMIEQIRKNKFTAQELRDKLPLICENEKAYEKFVSGKMDLTTAYEKLENDGKTENISQKFKKMHEYVNTLDKETLENLNQKTGKYINFKMVKIITKLRTLREQVFK